MGLIVADDVRKLYGDITALAGVSLNISGGEVFSLIGPNGAGKTTLVRCLTGTTTPSEGDVSVLDSDPSDLDKSLISVLPQDFDPPELLSARELVNYYAGLYPDARDTGEVLEEVGITDAAGTRYQKLSGGQKRRVCVGASLVNDPEVLFLDEPTTGIDPAGRRSIWDLIEGLADEGTTVFLTTHYMEEAESLSDRVGLLHDGELVKVGSPQALIRKHGGKSKVVVNTEVSTSDLDIEAEGYEIEKNENQIIFHDVAPSEVGEVIDTLSSEGVEYDEFMWKQPDLEDVYLRLTDAHFASESGETAIGGRD
ncbi:MAG: ABC transporter ATP-binding protein [Halobacteria archaeon]|nr:ABC transporter ATP-binding protein [Halobacteria archaeon]